MTMTDNRYPVETLAKDQDDGTMPDSVDELRTAVIGHRIASVTDSDSGKVITLDNGRRVILRDTSDCCAVTELTAFLLHPEMVDHIITGVGTTGDYTTWHIYVDAGDVLELTVDWSCGNPFYYVYGFGITVEDAEVAS